MERCFLIWTRWVRETRNGGTGQGNLCAAGPGRSMRRATFSIAALIAAVSIRTPKRPAAVGEERLEIGGRSLPLVIVRSPRARRAALRVDATRGEIRLTLPPRVEIGRASCRERVCQYV